MTVESLGGAARDSFLSAEEPRTALRTILADIAKIAVPNIATYLLTLINELTNTIFLGHAGNQAALAAIGLANMMQNCVGLSVGFGFCGALDPEISQAYGAKQHDLCCHYLQRCRVLVSLQLIWMIPVLAFSEQWLRGIHQDAEVAHDAGEYNRASVWGLIFIFQFEATKKFLQNRGDATPAAIISAVTSTLHVVWCAFFVLYLRWGNRGAGWANVTTWFLQYALSSVYLAWTAKRQGLSMRSVLWVEAPGLRGWGSYLKIAVPATVQLCSEWWFWEVCALIVGYLGKVALAAHVATLNWVAISFMPVIGLQVSTATLVGNALGANLPRKAKTMTFTCVALNAFIWTLMAGVMVFGRKPLSSAYSNDDEIRELMQALLCIFAVAGYFDSTQNIMGGALRGMNLQQWPAVTYIVCYYLVMLPLGCLGAFSWGFGLYGIWYSFGLGTAMAAVVFAIVLCRLDFGALAAEASDRMAQEGALAHDGATGAELGDVDRGS